jgi:hypothetical protein
VTFSSKAALPRTNTAKVEKVEYERKISLSKSKMMSNIAS